MFWQKDSLVNWRGFKYTFYSCVLSLELMSRPFTLCYPKVLMSNIIVPLFTKNILQFITFAIYFEIIIIYFMKGQNWIIRYMMKLSSPGPYWNNIWLQVSSRWSRSFSNLFLWRNYQSMEYSINGSCKYEIYFPLLWISYCFQSSLHSLSHQVGS